MFENNLITKEYYKEFLGDDLDMILPYCDDEANKSARAIFHAQEDIVHFCIKASLRKPIINKSNEENFKMAIAWQVHYRNFENYLPNTISEKAYTYLKLGGFLNVMRE